MVLSHNAYLYCIREIGLSIYNSRVWYNLELLLFVMPLIWMGNYNHKSKRENQFRLIAYGFVSLVMAIIILNKYNLIPFPAFQVYYLNGITIVIVLYALVFSDKNGNL